MHHGILSEALFLIRFLLCKDVVLKSALPFDLPSAGELKTLLGAGIGLHLRHRFLFI